MTRDFFMPNAFLFERWVVEYQSTSYTCKKRSQRN